MVSVDPFGACEGGGYYMKLSIDWSEKDDVIIDDLVVRKHSGDG